MGGPLEGVVIGVTADRRWQEQADLLSRRGATVVHAPTMTTVFLADDDGLRQATDAVVADPPDYLVATTGMGIRAWIETAAEWGIEDRLLDALSGIRVVARGPKSAKAVREAGLDVWQSSPDEQMQSLAAILAAEPLSGRRIALQEYGTQHEGFRSAMSAAGATIVGVPVYRWRIPDDTAPARDLTERACAGSVHAVTFTSAPAVHNLFAIAAAAGRTDPLRDAFNDRVVAACVGPVCAAGARTEGITRPLAPDVGRLGLLVRALSEHFSPSPA